MDQVSTQEHKKEEQDEDHIEKIMDVLERLLLRGVDWGVINGLKVVKERLMSIISNMLIILSYYYLKRRKFKNILDIHIVFKKISGVKVNPHIKRFSQCLILFLPRFTFSHIFL